MRKSFPHSKCGTNFYTDENSQLYLKQGSLYLCRYIFCLYIYQGAISVQ